MDRTETLRWMERIPRCATELVGRDVVLLSHQRWEEHFTPVHGTTLRLAQRNRVLFMEPPDSWGWIPHLLHESDHRHVFARRALKHTFKRLETFSPNFAVYHTPPVFIPCQARSDLIVKSMDIGYSWMIREGIRRMGLVDPIFWIFLYNTTGTVTRLNPTLSVYECAEEAAQFVESGNLEEYVRRKDAELCKRADVVIVPNPTMRAAREDICREIHMLPWPVDADHYGQAMNPELPIPEAIARIPKPIIGIYANIDVRRFDVDFLCALAKRRPQWHLVLIGRVLPDFDPRPLRALPNIHFIPKQPLEDLPAFVKAFDVCMIPYAINAFTRSITPLKMTEYLASGKPVVTTSLPAAEMYADVLRIAENLDEFETHIDAALAEDPECAARRVAVARANDWDSYMKQKTAVVQALLADRERHPTANDRLPSTLPAEATHEM